MIDLGTDLLQPQNLLLLGLAAASVCLRPRGSVKEAQLLHAGQFLAFVNVTAMTELGQPELTACSALIGTLVSAYALTRREVALNPWLRFTPPVRRPALVAVTSRT